MKPIVSLLRVEASPPGLHDNTADLDRLQQAMATALTEDHPLTIPYRRVVPLARAFRQAGFSGYALVNEEAQGWVAADFFTERPPVVAGMALDLGTTHLEATLLDLENGKVLAEFQDKGVQADQIPRDVLLKLKEVTQEVLKEEASKDADFKRVYESQQEFMETYKIWDTRAYVPADL